MMRFCVLVPFIYLFIVLEAQGQDERFFRSRMLDKKMKKKELIPPDKVSSLVFKTSSYEIDIDEDGFKETLEIGVRDGLDFIEINNANGLKVFDASFETKGPKSRIYKIEFRKISSITRILIIYYFEGVTNYLSLVNKGHLYFLTLDKKDFKTLRMTRGPLFWIENKTENGHYSQRNYAVDIFDFNKDGIKEIRAKFHQLSTLSMYKGNGSWIML